MISARSISASAAYTNSGGATAARQRAPGRSVTSIQDGWFPERRRWRAGQALHVGHPVTDLDSHGASGVRAAFSNRPETVPACPVGARLVGKTTHAPGETPHVSDSVLAPAGGHERRSQSPANEVAVGESPLPQPGTVAAVCPPRQAQAGSQIRRPPRPLSASSM